MEQVEQQQDKKGSVLLLTLIITMIILTSSVVLGTLIIGSLRRSQSDTAAITAYYAVESLTEKTLYDLRKIKKVPSEIDQDCIGLPGGYPGIASSSCKTQVQYITTLSFNIFNNNQIKKNQTAHVRLINTSSIDPNAGAESAKIICTSSSGTWLEITSSVISYYDTQNRWYPDAGATKKYLYSCPNNNIIIDLSASNSYDIAIKALYGDAYIVSLTPYAADNAVPPAVNIGESFTLRSWADYSLFSRQEIKVEIKGVSTVSSLFDNVLYSEQAITKDIIPGSS